MAKILYATQFFDPEPAIKGRNFAEKLSGHKYEVSVVTGLPNYPHGKFYPNYGLRSIGVKQHDLIKVIRLPLIPAHGRNTLMRAANYLSFFVSLFIWGVFSLRKYDAIYVYHPPLTVGLAIMFAAKIYRKPFIVEIQDLWPESVVSSTLSGTKKISGILSYFCSLVYKNAVHIVGQSYGMCEILIQRGAKAETTTPIYNWSSFETNEPISKNRQRNRDEFHVYYTGNIGVYQELNVAIEAIRIAHRTNSMIRLFLVGDGSEKQHLQNSLSEYDKKFIHFIPSMPSAQLIDLLKDADILLLNLKDQPFFEFTIPSKLQFYLSLGLPIVAGIGGEAKKLLQDSGAAIIVDQGSVTNMVDAFNEIMSLSHQEHRDMGAAGLQFYKKNLSMDSAIEKTQNVIEKALE